MLNVKQLRIDARLTQQEVATELGVAQSSVSAWESGEANPSAEKLPELAKLLGCTLDDLFAEEEEDEDTSAENAPRA